MLISLATSLAFSQARVVLNNNGYIVIDNSAYVVLANPNANALTTLGTGGNIVSEAETDVIQWEIGQTTGTYVIPWTTASGVKIPLSINKTSAGTGLTSEFILSTWETATDMNAPWPSAVSNMNIHLPATFDGSFYVADRFWHIDALSYAAKPDITMSMNYDASPNEIDGSNTIVESNLLAQRFNTALNHWETYKLFGTNNAASDQVTGIVVPAADFFEDWILVDNSNPLPVELVSFDVKCETEEAEIEWITQSEINNDYFIVEKSYDAVTYFELTKIQGAGNSNVAINYSVTDPNPSSGVTYYRLKQVDFDGTTTYHETVATNCNTSGFDVNQLVLNNNALNFNITSTQDEELTIYFYDYRGRIILNKKEMITKGNNTISLPNLNISTGIYMLSIIGEFNNFATKLMNTKDL
jgi:hypothetical protein